MRICDLLTEDEYDQFDQPKDPNFRNVNANQLQITSPTWGKQKDMKPEELAQWRTRQQQLQARANKIFEQLKSIMPEEDRSAMTGVKVTVPFDGTWWAEARFDDKIIVVDLGSFWDLSNDCLAYVIGHEMGHMVWAYGPKKMWPKTRNRKRTPAQGVKEESDADVYGALLAHQLGYNRRKAWDHFTIADQREPFDPKSGYPSVDQRKANVEKALKARAAGQDKTQEPQQTQPDQEQIKSEKSAWFDHIMNGMQKFDVALANNPDIQLA